jgi:hypothetical protein
MRKTNILCALLLLTACCKFSDIGTRSSEIEVPADFHIKLTRTGCFAAANACPTYEVAIDAVGNVSYNGKDVVEHIGRADGKAAEDDLRKLIRELDRIEFFDKNDNYQPGDPECIRTATDQPGAGITLRMNGREKHVSHYLGCFGEDSKRVPRDLIELQLLIDEVAGTRRWIGEYYDRIRK